MAKEKTVRVTVANGHMLDDGKKQYLPGDGLDLPEEEAADLVERGVVEAGKEKSAGPPEAVLTKDAGNVEAGIKLVESADTPEALDAMLEGETRKGVLDAARQRRLDLGVNL